MQLHIVEGDVLSVRTDIFPPLYRHKNI